MTILNLSTTNKQGAGLFASYFNNLLIANGYDSYLVVKNLDGRLENLNTFEYKHKKYEYIFDKYKRSKLRKKFKDSDFVEKYIFYNKYEQTSCYSSKSILSLLPQKPDIIFIHWVSGFINYRLIKELRKKTNAQVIILMIDNAPITGGCHYPWDCNGYMYACENCPAINTDKNLAHKNYLFKQKYIENNEKIIAFSHTDFARLKSSSLFINNPKFLLIASVNQHKYKPVIDENRYIDIKQKFKISTKKPLILIAATFLDEERKGMKYLLNALENINKNDFQLLIVGNNNLDVKKYNHQVLGYLNEDELIEVFQIVDVFVCPTVEDSGPIMINQSIMTGTPVVAFKTGVAENIIIDNETGYLADKGDYTEFANGIKKIISQNELDRIKMKQNCRDFALKTFSEEVFLENIKTVIAKV